VAFKFKDDLLNLFW